MPIRISASRFARLVTSHFESSARRISRFCFGRAQVCSLSFRSRWRGSAFIRLLIEITILVVLLVAALGVDQTFWRQHTHWRAELDEIAQRTLASLRGRSHKAQDKFHMSLDALAKAYDTFAAATSAV